MNIIVRTGMVLAGCVVLGALAARAARGAGENPQAWTKMGPGALTEEFLKLASWGTVKDLDCRRLARYAEERFAADRARGALDAKQWLAVPMIMGTHLSPPGAQAMAQEIHKQLIAQARPLATLTAEEMYQAAIALARGNWSPEAVGGATARWIRASENFAQAPPELLVELVARLDQAGEDARDARVKVADRLESGVLADPAKARAITIGQWDRLVWVLGKDLPAGRGASWGAKLYTIFVADAAVLGQCTLGDCASLQNTLRQLAHPQAERVLVEWVEKTTAWQGRPLDELAPLGEGLCRLGKGAQGAVARVAGYVESKYMADGSALAGVGVGRWEALCGAMGKSPPPAAEAAVTAHTSPARRSSLMIHSMRRT